MSFSYYLGLLCLFKEDSSSRFTQSYAGRKTLKFKNSTYLKENIPYE